MFNFFENVNKGQLYEMSVIENGQILLYFHFNKKGLELVSRLQHWAKSMLEMFVIRRTSI